MEKPLVSVVVPVYNGERYLGEALKSIFAQDYRPLEVIVVDDGSTDTSASIARSFEEINYFYQQNQGPSAARNAGIAAASGEFIAFLDADDVWLPNKLSIQVKYLMDHPEVGFVLARQRMIIEEGVEKPPWYRKDIFEEDNVCFGPSATVARRSAFREVGSYDPDYRYGEIAQWLTRAKDAGILKAVIPETLIISRVHGRNQTYHLDEMRSNILRALKASIDRQRGQKRGGPESS